jgi:hypothetical protein
MRLSKTDFNTLAKKKCQYKLEVLFKEFLGMNVKCAELVDHHYANTNSAQSCLQDGAKKWAKNVRVMARDGKVYLVRTDID